MPRACDNTTYRVINLRSTVQAAAPCNEWRVIVRNVSTFVATPVHGGVRSSALSMIGTGPAPTDVFQQQLVGLFRCYTKPYIKPLIWT